MKQFILRRPLLAVVTLSGVSWLIFAIMWMIPGDGAIAILGDGAKPERVAALRAQSGSERSLVCAVWTLGKGHGQGRFGHIALYR